MIKGSISNLGLRRLNQKNRRIIMEPKITLEDLPALKVAYKQAVDNKQEIFLFTGSLTGGEVELLTAYAKYLIEYLGGFK